MNITKRHIEAIARHLNPSQRNEGALTSEQTQNSSTLQLASDPTTDPEILASLAKTVDADVLEAVAGNVSTPRLALGTLCSSAIDAIRWQAGANQNLPECLMANIQHDPIAWVRESVAINIGASPQILAEMALDPDEVVRWQVAQNANTTSAVLSQLEDDTDVLVARTAALHLKVRSGEEPALAFMFSTEVVSAVAAA